MSVSLPVSRDENALVNRLLEQLDARKRRNLLRAAYYDGKSVLGRAGSIIPPEYIRTATVLGWAAQAVDGLAMRCNLDRFVWPDGDLDSLGAQQVWDDNYFAAESNNAIVSSLIHGVAFLINSEGDVGEPDSLIHVKSAINATGDWNPYLRSLDNLLSVTARDESGEPVSLNLYLDGETILADKDAGKWQVDRFEHPWGVPAEALVFQPRAERPLGSSRISRAVMSIHDRAVRACCRMEGNADVYSIPQMILLGADESVFRNTDGSFKPAWKVALGRIFALPDDESQENPRADVKQFQAASPQPHIDMLKQIAQQFAGVTSIPIADLGVADMANPTSADSMTNMRDTLISVAEGADADWAPAFRRSMIRALAIANKEKQLPEEWAGIDTKWRSPMHLSRAAQADAGMKQLSAVPWLADTTVGLELLGLSEQQIARAMSEKRRAVGRSVLQTLQQRAAAAPVTPPPVEVPVAAAAG